MENELPNTSTNRTMEYVRNALVAQEHLPACRKPNGRL